MKKSKLTDYYKQVCETIHSDTSDPFKSIKTNEECDNCNYSMCRAGEDPCNRCLHYSKWQGVKVKRSGVSKYKIRIVDLNLLKE